MAKRERKPMALAAPEILNSGALYRGFDDGSSPGVWYGDGREEAVLDFVQKHASLASMWGNPSAIVAAVDEYGQSQKFLMTLGQHKLQIIRGILGRMHPKPKSFIEMGTYVGYSAVAFGGMLRDMYGADAAAQGVKIYTLDFEPRFAAIANKLIELAGLSDVVQVMVGPASESIRCLHAETKVETVDVLLVDHFQQYYVQDLKVCEDLKLLKKGSLVLADNTVLPGAPDYLDYVRNNGDRPVKYESKGVDSMIPIGCKDSLEVSTVVECD